MAEYGLYKNSEGYADPTAYEAIRGMAKPGEIWTYKDREVLIIKNQGSYSNILQLGAYKKGGVEIAGRYAQAGMLSYAFNDLLAERVETLPDNEFADVLREAADALGMQVFFERDKVKVNEDALAMQLFVPLETESAEVEYINPALDAEKAALKAQVEMLQNMYNDLLGKVIAKVGA